MNRYMHCDFYPDFHVNFIKKGSVNDVPPVALKDMGLSDDVDYRDQPLEELPKDRKEAIIAEFMFLIDRLLPRNIQDLFYRIALDPRPAYCKSFEQAVFKMQLARYTDHNKNNYGQFVDHVQTGIMDMIADGMSVQDIYDSTCVTKSMLTETADALYMGDYSSQDHARWQIIPIELALFGMKDVTYSFNEEMTEFQIKRGNNDSLAIILVSYEDYFDIDCVIEELEFTEPFVEFQLYPATEDCDVSADWRFCLWYDEETRKQVFTNNYLILDMDRDDIEMLVKYLESLSD